MTSASTILTSRSQVFAGVAFPMSTPMVMAFSTVKKNATLTQIRRCQVCVVVTSPMSIPMVMASLTAMMVAQPIARKLSRVSVVATK